MVLSSYTFLLYATSFGVVDGFLKLGSMSGKGDQNRLYVGTILSWGGLFVGGGSLIVMILISEIYTAIDLVDSITVVGLCLSAFFFNALETFFRATQQFLVFAFMVFAKVSIATGLGCFFAVSDRPSLVLGAEVMAFFCVALFFLLWGRAGKVDLRVGRESYGRFVHLVRHGLPLLLTNIAKKLIFVADRWVVVTLLGMAVLAKYSFIMLIYLGTVSLIGILNAKIGPKILSMLGKDGDLVGMRKRIYSVMLRAFFMLLPFFGIFTVTYPSFVAEFFPNYVDPILYSSAKYLMFGMIIFFLNSIFDWLLIGSDQGYGMFLVNLGTLLSGFVCYLIFAFLPEIGLHDFAVAFLGLRVLSLFLSIALFEFKFRHFSRVILTSQG